MESGGNFVKSVEKQKELMNKTGISQKKNTPVMEDVANAIYELLSKISKKKIGKN